MNGFDDFDTEVQCEEVFQEDAISYDDSYEDHLAMYDNDPSPYDGTYSEE
jgi:hypothetical protein